MAELIWRGKYDKEGCRVQPPREALPFETLESMSGKSLNSPLFSEPNWQNRLIFGDKRAVLPSLLPEFQGKVTLIYIDPPFLTGSSFNHKTAIPDNPQAFLQQDAYEDNWGKGPDGYLQWFYETIVLLKDLLADNGSLYVHLDWHITHHAKLILDEVMGAENLVNEVIWYYRTGGVPEKLGFGKKHDNILFYAKNKANAIWNRQKEKSYLKHRYGFNNVEILQDEDGFYTMAGMRDVWDIPALRGNQPEKIDYPTQKPEALVERIIRASSNEGDLVLDCFCGSGTSAIVAEKLGRRWIAADQNNMAIHHTRKRLLSIPNATPFAIQTIDDNEYSGNSLTVTIEANEKMVELSLTDVVIAEEKVRQAISHWSQGVDYWAIDWDYQGDIFRNDWQSYRTRANSDLLLIASHNYEAPGSYQVAVQVIDIFGNEARKVISVKVI